MSKTSVATMKSEGVKIIKPGWKTGLNDAACHPGECLQKNYFFLPDFLADFLAAFFVATGSHLQSIVNDLEKGFESPIRAVTHHFPVHFSAANGPRLFIVGSLS